MDSQIPLRSILLNAGKVRRPAGLRPIFLFSAYLFICLIPIILAALQGEPMRNIFRELSSGLAMVGYVMTLLQFILSGRFEWISGRMGIDRTMRFHQFASWAIIIFIIAHPLLYIAPRLLTDPLGATHALWRMFMSPSLQSGVIAWFFMILLVVMAIFRDRIPIRYETWRLSHGLFAIAIAMLGTDHTLRVGSYSSDPWLACFWLVATFVAVLAMLHVYVLKPILKIQNPYRVLSNRKIADRTWEITIEPEGAKAINFSAGQFVWLNLGHSAFSLTEHPFSICSAPAQSPRLSFAIKESGDFTCRIGDVMPGTRAYVDGPHGNFILPDSATKGIAFIAGGVGIAPIMSILRQLRIENYPHPLRLIYGNRATSQILFFDELEEMARTLNFHADYVVSEPPAGWSGLVGDLSPDMIARFLKSIGPGEWLYFVCGPTPMMTSVERALVDHGVPSARIISERFKYD